MSADLLSEYPDYRYFDQTKLPRTMQDIYMQTHRKFVVIIDEWDCMLLVHLGYLAYDFERKEIYIPNQEVQRQLQQIEAEIQQIKEKTARKRCRSMQEISC